MRLTEGMRTSEFALVALLLAASIAYLALGESDMAKAAMGVGIGVATGGYAIARGLRKGGA